MTKHGKIPAGATRRDILRGAAAVTAGLAMGTPFRALAQGADTGPIKIGALNVYTKAGGIFGEAILENMKLYVEEHGGKVAGRSVVFLKEDDEFNPQVGLQKLRKLVESDKVDVIAGPLGSQIASAMTQYMKDTGTPWIVTGAGDTGLTKTHMPNLFRATLSNWQVSSRMGMWAPDNVGKEASIIASDYLAGHDIADGFKEFFVKGGGKIAQEIYTPIGTNDFSAYISRLGAAPSPITYVFYSGSDAVRFVNQYVQFGMPAKSQLVGFQSVLDAETFPAQGKNALGDLSSSIYCETLDTPENRKYVKLFQSKHNNAMPGVFDESGYTAMRIIADAATAVGGKLENRPAFLAALARTNIKAPRGPVSFDQVTHQAIQNIYIRKVAEMDGGIHNKLVKTYPNVGDYPGNRS